ncbi:MAG: hypothetical protein D6732_14470 [Methanobacteriota archaeon]|nr:MAG: hypothetical protein D6732_14470 [Euryarchaeota archaeon]
MNEPAPLRNPPQTGPIGRTGRAVMGILFLAITLRVFLVSTRDFLADALASAVAFLGIFIVYYALHRLIESGRVTLNGFSAAVLANGIVGSTMGLGYFLQNLPLFIGSTLYIGITLLISSYRKYPGCEVMSLPALLTRKHTSLPCLVFSQIDKWENAHSND